jgi:hypothetical protein
MIELIQGGSMYCGTCKQERDTNFIPVRLVCLIEKEVIAHTIRVCALCSSTDLKQVFTDNSRRIDSSFKWNKNV